MGLERTKHYWNIRKNAYTSQGIYAATQLLAEKPCAACLFYRIVGYNKRSYLDMEELNDITQGGPLGWLDNNDITISLDDLREKFPNHVVVGGN